MSTFKIVDSFGSVVARTDDWIEAHRIERLTRTERDALLSIRGTHPSHKWAGERCITCGAWDNGSYGSHAPCGYDFAGRSLAAILDAANPPHPAQEQQTPEGTSVRADIERAMQTIRDTEGRYDICPVNGARHLISPAAWDRGRGACGCRQVIETKE